MGLMADVGNPKHVTWWNDVKPWENSPRLSMDFYPWLLAYVQSRESVDLHIKIYISMNYIYIYQSLCVYIYTNINDSDNEHLNISLTCLVSYLFWVLLPSNNGALEEANQVFLKRTTSLKNNDSFSLFVFLLNLYGSVSKPCTPVVHIKIAGK